MVLGFNRVHHDHSSCVACLVHQDNVRAIGQYSEHERSKSQK